MLHRAPEAWCVQVVLLMACNEGTQPMSRPQASTNLQTASATATSAGQERPSGIPPAPVTRNYQDLDGGVGREVNFRPPRYQSAEFGPVGAVVAAVIDG